MSDLNEVIAEYGDLVASQAEQIRSLRTVNAALLEALEDEMDLLSIHRSVQHMNHLRGIIALAKGEK